MAFCMMNSVYKLNKQGENIQPWHTPFLIWNQSAVPCPVLTGTSWLAYWFLRRQVRSSGIPISWRIFHSLLWSTQSEVYPEVLQSMKCQNDFNGWHPGNCFSLSNWTWCLGECHSLCVLPSYFLCEHQTEVHMPHNNPLILGLYVSSLYYRNPWGRSSFGVQNSHRWYYM